MMQDTIIAIAAIIIAVAFTRNFPRWAYNTYKRTRERKTILAKTYNEVYEIFTEGT